MTLQNGTLTENLSRIAEIYTEMRAIEMDIRVVRYDTSLSNNERIEQISQLMDRRNAVYDELQETRKQNLRSFVDTLKLKNLNVVSFFPSPHKCNLVTKNQDVPKVRPQKEEPRSPWQKLVSRFSKQQTNSPKENASPAAVAAEAEYKTYASNRRHYLQSELKSNVSLPYHNSEDLAIQKRLQIEIELLNATLS